jgi:hypothetical protein
MVQLGSPVSVPLGSPVVRSPLVPGVSLPSVADLRNPLSHHNSKTKRSHVWSSAFRRLRFHFALQRSKLLAACEGPARRVWSALGLPALLNPRARPGLDSAGKPGRTPYASRDSVAALYSWRVPLKCVFQGCGSAALCPSRPLRETDQSIGLISPHPIPV